MMLNLSLHKGHIIQGTAVLWKRSSLTQKAVWTYLGIAILSSLFSPWKDIVWLGFAHREGLLTILLYEIHQMLHGEFLDSFGTMRGLIWKRTLPLIREYRVLGSGPDTFVMRFMPRFFDEFPAGYPFSVVDTAENEYLTIAVNLGIWGLAACLTAICSQIARVVKISRRNRFPLILAG